MAINWEQYRVKGVEGETTSQPSVPNNQKTSGVINWEQYRAKPSPETQVSNDTYTLPDYLGGGQFKGSSTLKPKELDPYKSKREDLKPNTIAEVRGGSFQETQKEVDHKISLALGGTNSKQNLQALKNDKNLYQTVFDIMTGNERDSTEYAVRQEGKVEVEQRAIDKYIAGDISLAEARSAVVNWKNPEPFLHEEEKKGKYLVPELKKALDTVITPVEIIKRSLAKKNQKEGGDIPTSAPFGTGEQYQITEEDVKRNPNLKDIYEQTKVETTALGGPRVRTEELVKKGIEVKDIPSTAPFQQETVSMSDQAKLDIPTSAPFLSTPGPSDEIKTAASKTWETLKTAEMQFKSGPRGKLEVAKGTVKGLAEATSSFMSFTEKARGVFDPISYIPQVKKANAEKYRKIDEQIAKIVPKENYEDAFVVGKFVGDSIPYIASDMAIVGAFKALPLALRTSKMAQEAAEITSWVSTGQILHRPEDGSRTNQLLMDLGGYLGFKAIGMSGLGLKKIVEEQVASDAFKGLRNKLSDTSKEIADKLIGGKQILDIEAQHLDDELKTIENPGTVPVKGIETTTNNVNQLENYVQNTKQIEYKIDPEAKTVKVTFPKTDAKIVRVVAPTLEDLASASKQYGNLLPVAVQREIFDTFSAITGKNVDMDNLISSLTSYAVSKGYNNPQAITNEIERFLKAAQTEITAAVKKYDIKSYQELIDRTLRQGGGMKGVTPNLHDFITKSAKLEGIKLPDIPKIKETPKLEAKLEGVQPPTKAEIKLKEIEAPEVTAKKQEKVNGVPAREPMAQKGIEKPTKKSKLYERMQDFVAEEFRNKGVAYTQMDLEENAKRAIEIVNSKTPDEILDIVRGLTPEPQGATDLRLGVALFNKAMDAGNADLAAEAMQALTRRATREGQEIASLRGVFKGNTTESFIREVINRRIEKANKLFDTIKQKLGKNVDVISNEAKALKRQIAKKAAKIKSAQSILDQLTCK